MSCKHPNIIVYRKNGMVKKNGELGTKVKFIGSNSPHFIAYEDYLKTMDELKKDKGWNLIKENGHEIGFKLTPCRKCIGCRFKETSEWALRIECEAKQYKHNYFLTLTYNDENLPMKDISVNEDTGEYYTAEEMHYNWKGTLKKSDTQQFIKSLRTYFEREYFHNGLRFYLAGEYGDIGERPHYHVILMNCPDLDNDLIPCGMNRKTKHPYYTHKRIEHIWGKGFITIGKVNWDTISYTAGYCQKKMFNNIGKDIYARKGQDPIFANMSRRPGIGREYFNANAYKIYENDEIINGKGNPVKPPAYFDRLFMDIGESDYLEELKETRSEYANNELKKKLKSTSRPLKEQLQVEEDELKEKQLHYNRERI